MSSKDVVHLSQLIAIQRDLDRSASNVANIDTPGYRARIRSFHEYVKKSSDENPNTGLKSAVSLVRSGPDILNLSQGSFVETGSPLDVAIRSRGWFVIEAPQGRRYTRDGSFSLNREGVLVDRSGFPVASTTGIFRVSKSESTVSIAADGGVWAGASRLGYLNVVDFEDIGTIRPEGKNLYSAAGMTPQTVQPELAPGFIEKSNVSGASELVNIANLAQAYERVLRLMRSEASPDELQRLSDQS